jgi:hypothetical protein
VEWFPVESVDAFFDAHENRCHVFSIEGWTATEQDVENYSTGPIIHLFAVLSVYYFGGEVHGGSLWLVLELFFLEYFGNSKVN